MKFIKWVLLSILLVCFLTAGIVYLTLNGSLPKLDDSIENVPISANATLSRDDLGTAVIYAETKQDTAFLLGYAHAQDRLFQLDLLRRQAAGELSELVGKRALEIDKKHRIHQFRQRAQAIFRKLPAEQQQVLQHYSDGVNQAAKAYAVKPFEYILTSSNFAPWQPVDSLLATYSMYIDLQLAQTEIDFHLTALKELFGDGMYQFFTLPSNYQSALDYTVIPSGHIDIPAAPLTDLALNNAPKKSSQAVLKNKTQQTLASISQINELPDIGSNNWAVAGKFTSSTSAMLSNDMHLGLRVPSVWYRTQLNYTSDNQAIQVTGLSLPGTPILVVGSNGHVAWGFTNANIDNVDWVKLSDNAPLKTITEEIITPEGAETFTFEMSEYGPVRQFRGVKYALKWVAHEDYAVNLNIADMPKVTSVEEGLAFSKSIRIPVQNMVIADSQGHIAWQLTGAITGRTNNVRHAIDESDVSPLWSQNEAQPANHIDPENGRVWSANARVMGVEDLQRFGDGGYALGARQQQIMKRLLQQSSFTEQDFYNIQLDNQALFLMPWHNLLVNALKNNPQKYAEELQYLNDWQACACEDSVGYTLVRRFRSRIINQLIAPIDVILSQYDLDSSNLLRGIEPAIWAIIEAQPSDWLPSGIIDYQSFFMSAYDATKVDLLNKFGGDQQDLAQLTWGNVNTLRVNHPFASSLGVFSSIVNMPEVAGFGDSFLPAVQSGSFGASQRLIVRPGNEDKAILTVPGGQSGHPLSPYFKTGFKEYATQQHTPLLPSETQHSITFIPASATVE